MATYEDLGVDNSEEVTSIPDRSESLNGIDDPQFDPTDLPTDQDDE